MERRTLLKWLGWLLPSVIFGVWNGTKDWSATTLASADMDTYVSDNLDALKDPPAGYATLNEASNYTTTSTNFVNVDATEGKLQHTIAVVGSRVFVGGTLVVSHASPSRIYFDVAIDGTVQGGDDGYAGIHPSDAGLLKTLTFEVPITGITPGSRIFTLQWKVFAGTATLYAGAGTANFDLHSTFWVEER